MQAPEELTFQTASRLRPDERYHYAGSEAAAARRPEALEVQDLGRR